MVPERDPSDVLAQQISARMFAGVDTGPRYELKLPNPLSEKAVSLDALIAVLVGLKFQSTGFISDHEAQGHRLGVTKAINEAKRLSDASEPLRTRIKELEDALEETLRNIDINNASDQFIDKLDGFEALLQGGNDA